MQNKSDWPSLPLDSWRDTYSTLHRWTQIVGKIALALTPRMNHYWNIAMQVTARGLATQSLVYKDRSLTITFDFIAHELVIHCSDGGTEAISLQPRTVAEFYRLVMDALRRLGVEVRIWPVPVEIPEPPIRFDEDTVHRSYDGDAANRFWRILLAIKPVFEAFRCEFIGKSSPVHFFWGSFDLASTRFSGRPAPERPNADAITKEAYSHEVISHGFWPGGGAISEPMFYAYAAPEPAGFKDAAIRPAAAFYTKDLSEFFLPYESVRSSSSREADLNAFLTSTYNAGADLGKWDRAALERSR
jgi:hypothetical protein